MAADVAYGDAHRGLGVPNTEDTVQAMASGSRVFTACAMLALVSDGPLDLDASIRRWLRPNLPEIAADVDGPSS